MRTYVTQAGVQANVLLAWGCNIVFLQGQWNQENNNTITLHMYVLSPKQISSVGILKSCIYLWLVATFAGS